MCNSEEQKFDSAQTSRIAESSKKFRRLKFKVYEKELQENFKCLTDAGFEVIAIKGWAAALAYPEPFERQSVDFDLMVEPTVYGDALEVLRKIRQEVSLPKNYPVDLHAGARRHDTLSFADLLAESLVVKCGQTNIRIPRPEDHLRILCVHWLTDGGAHREKLLDIYYAVKNRKNDFDWERLLGVVSPTRRRWITCTIGLAHKYLGLEIRDTPIAPEAVAIPDWICRTVEREWASRVRLQPLPNFFRRRGEFIEQVGKRLPPNPIHATVQSEGEFDDGSRIKYQLKNIFERSLGTIRREWRKPGK